MISLLDLYQETAKLENGLQINALEEDRGLFLKGLLAKTRHELLAINSLWSTGLKSQCYAHMRTIHEALALTIGINKHPDLATQLKRESWEHFRRFKREIGQQNEIPLNFDEFLDSISPKGSKMSIETLYREFVNDSRLGPNNLPYAYYRRLCEYVHNDFLNVILYPEGLGEDVESTFFHTAIAWTASNVGGIFFLAHCPPNIGYNSVDFEYAKTLHEATMKAQFEWSSRRSL